MHDGVKGFLKAIPGLRPTVSYFRARAKRRRNSAHLLRKIFGAVDHVKVVQIGSNDGITQDPVHDLVVQNPTWRALFIEPVPFLFAKLRSNYGDDPRFRFEMVAIGNGETLPFYYVSPEAAEKIPDLPVFFDQLGSFDSTHIVRHLGQSIVPFIVETNLRTEPLSSVLERCRIEQIDMLHIDAEGSDWRILQQLDLAKFRPKVILVEKKHLDEKSRAELRAFLQDYKIAELDDDYLCSSRR